jgi:hypothetical protein
VQSIGALSAADLRAKVQEVRYRLEILDDSSVWRDLSALYGKNYLNSLSVTPSGAGPTPEVIAGEWSAEIANPDGIFHALHPTSPYASYFRIGRKVRISVGGDYNGTPYLWQRLIGYMNEPKFDHRTRTVHLSGNDYAKRLADFELRSPDNYWGAIETISSVATTENFGSELYDNSDAVRISPEGTDMVFWVADDPTRFSTETESGGGSTYVAQLTKAYGVAANTANIDSIGSITSGKYYKVTFKYRIISGDTDTTEFWLRIYETGGLTKLQGGVTGLKSWEWATGTFYFTANATGMMRVNVNAFDLTYIPCGVQWDVISIKEVQSYSNASYAMPGACNGPYYVTLDSTPVFFNDPKEKDGWLYDESGRILSFVTGAQIPAGTNNLLVYYYTTQTAENVVADILADAGLYASGAAALADMDYAATGVTIDRCWFDAGTTAIEAIRMICERCNYRFWFSSSGKPTFKPVPTALIIAFSFDSFGNVTGLGESQDIEQVRNRVVIEGIEQGMYSAAEDKKTTRLSGTTSDAASIAANLEHTESIQNHLFQTQASINAMAAEILNVRANPRWYANLEASSLPVPLEVGDGVTWPMWLSPTLTVWLTGVVTGISLDGSTASYAVEIGSRLPAPITGTFTLPAPVVLINSARAVSGPLDTTLTLPAPVVVGYGLTVPEPIAGTGTLPAPVVVIT